LKLAVVVLAFVALAAAEQNSFTQLLKKMKLPAALDEVAEHEKVKAALLQVPVEHCTVIYHVPEGEQAWLAMVVPGEGCNIDEPDSYTFHARSGTLVVVYNEDLHDVEGVEDVSDLSIRAFTGDGFPGHKLKPSLSEGCRLCRRGYIHEVSRVVTDDCVDEQCVCEKTGDTALFDTIDRRGECRSAEGRAYHCNCRNNCTFDRSGLGQYCNVPLNYMVLGRNQRTTHSSESYSDLSSSEWTESSKHDRPSSSSSSSDTPSDWVEWSSTESSADSSSSSSSSSSESHSSWSSWSESESSSSSSSSDSSSDSGSESESWTWTRQ